MSDTTVETGEAPIGGAVVERVAESAAVGADDGFAPDEAGVDTAEQF